MFFPGFDIETRTRPIGFTLGSDCFESGTELRTLDSIRASLSGEVTDGPENVYAIMMDVGKRAHYEDLVRRHLLYGAVCYAKGRLGEEPVRSQGHIHKVSVYSGMSTPEVYEIWTGKAIVYMQENGGDDPGRCFAVCGEAGDVIIVPPYWTHATINADPMTNMSFGAWCDRDYGFEYDEVRRHGGIAWFPKLGPDGALHFEPNPAYNPSELTVKKPSSYAQLGLEPNVPIYTQYERDPSRFDFVPRPQLAGKAWENFVP